MYPVKCTCFWIIICGLFVLLLLGLTFFICISMEVLRTYHPIRQKLIHLCIQPPMVNRGISELAFCTFVASVGMWERSGPGDINSGRFELTACHNFPPIPPTFQGSCFLALLLLQNIMHYSPSNISIGHSHLTQYVTATGIYLMGL